MYVCYVGMCDVCFANRGGWKDCENHAQKGAMLPNDGEKPRVKKASLRVGFRIETSSQEWDSVKIKKPNSLSIRVVVL